MSYTAFVLYDILLNLCSIVDACVHTSESTTEFSFKFSINQKALDPPLLVLFQIKCSICWKFHFFFLQNIVNARNHWLNYLSKLLILTHSLLLLKSDPKHHLPPVFQEPGWLFALSQQNCSGVKQHMNFG